MPVASAIRAPATCRSPACPITWSAASATRTMAVTAMGVAHSTPPDGLTGWRLPRWNSPFSRRRPAPGVVPPFGGGAAALPLAAERGRLDHLQLDVAEGRVEFGHVDLAPR